MKTTLTIFLLLVVSTVSSQSIWIKTAPSFSDMLVKYDNNTFDTHMIFGYDFGVFIESSNIKPVSFETGIQFVSRGTKVSENGSEIKIQPSYIQIPFSLKYKHNLDGVKMYGAFGPYLGYGIGGQTYMNSVGTKIAYGDNENDDLKPLDIGLNFGAGVEIKAFQIGLIYNLGLANVNSVNTNGSKIANRAIGISVGFRVFNK